MALLEAMVASRYSLYMIQETVPAKGAMVTDMLRQDSFLLADRALSRSGTPGMMFAMRLIFFDDFAIQSGAAIPISDHLTSGDSVMTPIRRSGAYWWRGTGSWWH